MPRGPKAKSALPAPSGHGYAAKMRFKEDRPFATPEAAERKLLELANVIEADHAERLSVAVINKKFRGAGGSCEEIPHGGDHRNCARLAHDASVRRLFIVHAGRGGPVRVVGTQRNIWQGFGVFISEKSLGACHLPVAYRRL